MSLTPFEANKLYLFTISCTAQLSAPAAFLGSVTTGISKCGIPLYPDSSTILGSTSIIFTSLGLALYNIDTIIELMHTLLPEPVAPAISICGILAISPTHTSPAAFFPSAKQSLDLWFLNTSESITSLNITDSATAFGTSIPTAAFPGIGASILIDFAAKFKAISSAKLTILLTLTPVLGVSSYLVTVGPFVMLVTLASTPKLASVFCNLTATACIDFLSKASPSFGSWSKSIDGKM